MSTSQCAVEPGLADPPADLEPGSSASHSASPVESRDLKGVLIGFAAIVTVGLALASWYVGARIVDANEAVPVRTSVIASAKASAPPPGGPSTSEEAMAEAFWYTVPPPPPELFLQVAGLGSRQDASFVKMLEAKGYQARVILSETDARSETDASGTDGSAADDSRILIGPFVGQMALKKAERKLQSAGVLAIETER
jgi:hypothetical protein